MTKKPHVNPKKKGLAVPKPKIAATGFQFLVPADQVDFPNGTQQALLATEWDVNLTAFTEQGMVGTPWNATNASPITNYFNPKVTPIPTGTPTVPIQWVVFPNRINYYCSTYTQTDIYSLADTGLDTSGKSFPEITNPCTLDSVIYGPYGPRGWQDEYCEWSIAYDANGNITRIDFTCESPEYWNTLWAVDPGQVLSIYQETLGKPQIALEDLYLSDENNQPVIDPSTGRPLYNPLNKWNSGTLSNDTQGGAMHLTSTPNTIQTDIGLANQSTIQRTIGNTDQEKLICCAQFGQPMRNSDPHIGQMVNQNVGNHKLTLSLCNPPGLYMQLPDFSQFTFPEGTTYSDYYTVVRGNLTLDDPSGGQLPGNFILHAVFEAPAGFTIQQVLISKGGTAYPIKWAGQIAETINNQIVAYGLAAPVPAALGCVGTPVTADTYAAPLQLFHADVFAAMSATAIPNPVNQPMTLISNSTMIAPKVVVGASAIPMVVTCATTTTSPLPFVTFDSDQITAEVTSVGSITYAVPGNSYPSASTVLYINVSVLPGAPLGLHGLFVTNADQFQTVAMPGLINVVSQIV